MNFTKGCIYIWQFLIVLAKGTLAILVKGCIFREILLTIAPSNCYTEAKQGISFLAKVVASVLDRW